MGGRGGAGVNVPAVTALVEHVARTVVRPGFRSLRACDVSEKSPGDLVTVVDLAAEAALTAGLAEIAPAVPVVGKEAAEHDPALIDLIATGGRAWVVDPIDGTYAFVTGSPDHAVMVALVERGVPIGGWICLPEHERTYVAVRGRGAWCNGMRLPRLTPDLADLRGGVATKFLPAGSDALPGDVRERCEAGIGGIGAGARRSSQLWSGPTYARIADGREDFVFYWRTRPWDHAPGAVLVRELGGVSRRLDGSEYRVGDAEVGLVAAASPEAADRVLAELRPLG